MKSYTGTFTKADGSARSMRFVRLADLPDSFLAEKIKGNDTSEARQAARRKMLSEGKETVWDLDANNFRIFNWNTTVDDVAEIDIEDANFFKNNA
tara:strand:- start:5431 stop:5715 length:285 start_codon:yes stop_codon:yes gene_type:complete